jgi:uncharacterized Zn finger protein
MLLFSLRGISPAQLLIELKKSELGKAFSEFLSSPEETEVVLEETLYPKIESYRYESLSSQASFWEMGIINEIEKETSTNTTVVAALVKKQGDYPPFWNRQNSFIAVMENFYDSIRRKNRKSL